MCKVKSLLVIGYAAMLITAGCAEKQQCKPVERICAANVEKRQAMQAAEEVLGEMHFSVEKEDIEQGFIRTQPLSGAQFFEFWRSDSVGKFNSAEANLQSIRRTVELNMSEEGGQLCIDCTVRTERLSMPGREVTSSSRAYRVFSKSDTSMQKMNMYPEQKSAMAWIDLGKDVRLETEILKRIEKQIVKK